MADLWKQFRLRQSDAVTSTLDSPQGKRVVIELHQFVSFMYYKGFKNNLPHILQQISDLNTTLLVTAMESAYVDLASAESIHNHDRGPSPSKFGAAIACWINRVKPIQFMGEIEETSSEDADAEEDMALVNAIFALVVGRCYKWHFDYDADTEQAHLLTLDKTLPSKIVQIIEAVQEDVRVGEIIYHLAWRSPDFRGLIPIFQYL